MRERDALKIAKKFVRDHYPDYGDSRVEVALEHDGQRRRSWSFGVHIDEEDLRADENSDPATGYVMANGRIEGLYGAVR